VKASTKCFFLQDVPGVHSTQALYVFRLSNIPEGRSWWPRGLYGSAAARSLAGIVGLNPAGGHGCLSFLSVDCCQVEVPATG
jgi:hypothetical protein